MMRAEVPVVLKTSLSLRPLPTALLLVCAGVGACVVGTFFTLTLVPLLVAAGFLAALLIGGVVCAWAGVEALAALERWLERDSRFQR
ncbi:glypican [Synechococcus sp. RedBA-s]|nr:glypican [Synechococcus sp. RedBA-s]